MGTKTIAFAVASALLLLASPALAQQTVYVYEPEVEHDLLTPIGVSLAVGGGVSGFLNEDARDLTHTIGGAWDARLTIGTRTVIGVEIGYIGAAWGFDAAGHDDDAFLVSNGAEIAARLNLTDDMVQPYLFGGIGFQRFDVVNEDFNSPLIDEDGEEFGHFPVGAGLAFRGGNVVVDLRGAVRPTTGEGNMIGRDEGLHTWAAKLRIGGEF